MKSNHLICLVLLSLVLGCTTPTRNIQLETASIESNLPQDISSFCFPLVLELEQVESIINQKLPKSLLRNKKVKHNVKISIERAGQIRLGALNNQLLTYIPLKIKAKQGKIRSRMHTEFTVELCLSTDLEFTSKWKIHSTSRLKQINWLEHPTLTVLGIEFDIKSIVQNEIKKNESVLIAKVDQALHQKVNLKPQVEKTWEKLQVPHNVIKKTGEYAYLTIEPRDVYYIDHEIKNGQVKIDLLTSAYFNISTTKSDKKSGLQKLPDLSHSNTSCEGFDLNVTAKIGIDSLNSVLGRLIDKRLTMKVEGYSLTPTSANLMVSGNDLVVDVAVIGSMNGTIRGLCSLSLDTASQELIFFVEETQILSGDFELEIAHLVFGGFVNDYLENYKGFDLKNALDQIPSLVQKGLASGKSKDKWHPEIAEMSTKLIAIGMTAQDLIIQASCKGQVKIVIDSITK